MYRSFVCVIICFALIFGAITLSYASTDVTFPSPQPVYIDQGGYTIATVNSSGGVSFSSTSFVGAITNLCQSLGSIISYYKTSDITVNQANNTPRQTNIKGAIFDISMILSGIYADSSSIRNFINQANTTLTLIDNKLDSLYSVASSTNNYVYRIHDNTNTIEQELMDIHSEHGGLIQSILDTLYFDNVIYINTYIDNYIDVNIQSNSLTNANTKLNNYPYNGDNTGNKYFNSIIPVSELDNKNDITIYFPFNNIGDISTYSRSFTKNIYVSTDGINFEMIRSVNITNNYEINDNKFICRITIDADLSNYNYIGNVIYQISFSNNNNNNFNNCTPYILTQNNVKKSYFELWRELYASEDIINSKEQQKPLEETILGEFTGDGSASVSIGDASNMAEISSDIKNGFNAGGSVGGLMSVFNSNDTTLFSWFTQIVSDEINTLYNPTRSNNNIINFIDKQYEFINDNFN